MSQNSLISVDTSEGIMTITIERESKMNALNSQVISEIEVALLNAMQNDDVGAILLTGSGSKAFVAGADIAEFAQFDAKQGKELSEVGQKVFEMLEYSGKPTLAAVNGFALGGGCELAMACHLRIASTNAKFGQPEVNLGIIPGYGGTQRLVNLVGKAKALELMMTGDMIDAAEAHRLGLVNHVAEPDDLIATSRKLLLKILKKAPIAVNYVIECGNAAAVCDEDGYKLEAHLFGQCMNTEDFKEGTTAFLEKRKAQFQNK